ncbi:MAG: 1-deoxy-D-xylulose-5-phosphate synthase, partial [Nocardioides sp.]|nr:1-deoxy-D-xylulose-5-phosphate synthase [Nocardioides sp.]
RDGRHDVLVVGVGAMAGAAVGVAERLVAQGIGATVVDPRWVRPVDPAIVELARDHRLVVSIEDNGETGGAGAVLLQTLAAAGVTTPVRIHGIPQEFLDHAKREAILEHIGLTPQAIALDTIEALGALDPAESPLTVER